MTIDSRKLLGIHDPVKYAYERAWDASGGTGDFAYMSHARPAILAALKGLAYITDYALPSKGIQVQRVRDTTARIIVPGLCTKRLDLEAINVLDTRWQEFCKDLYHRMENGPKQPTL